eukprot:5691309-Heterocapsa_arctica.AAC.1
MLAGVLHARDIERGDEKGEKGIGERELAGLNHDPSDYRKHNVPNQKLLRRPRHVLSYTAFITTLQIIECIKRHKRIMLAGVLHARDIQGGDEKGEKDTRERELAGLQHDPSDPRKHKETPNNYGCRCSPREIDRGRGKERGGKERESPIMLAGRLHCI